MTALDDRPTFADGQRVVDRLTEDIAGRLEPVPRPGAGSAMVPPLVRASRAVAVVIAVGMAISSFILSFAALSDLARRTSSWGGWLPYLWPGIVDGAIVLATMGILTFSAYPDQRKAKQFFWAVLGVGTLVSVGGNALHAILRAGAPLPTWLTFVVACVPPAGILAATHVAQILWQFSASLVTTTVPSSRPGGVAPAGAHHDRGERWLPLAREIHDRGRLTNHSETTLTEALWRLFELQPQMSLRAIGEEVGVGHHDVIARVRQIASEVVRDRPDLVPMPVAIEATPGLAS
jgi:Protein of unknown function (DUF2637)